jgi:ubiquinone biosynthesis monooxygenase Coq6
VIVGGGPVGLALSSALSASKAVRDSLSVELIEAGPLSKVREWNPEPQTYSNRAVSLTNASQQFLQGLRVTVEIPLNTANSWL